MPTLTTDRPLKDAADQISKRQPLGSAMISREWELVPAEIRLRAMFSARVENERLLAEMRERLQSRIELARRDGRHIDRGVFIEEMRAELKKDGYRRDKDAPKGSLRDLKSTRRLGLIFDMNVAQAQGYARWKMDMTEDSLDNEPCYELVRVKSRVEHRPWPLVWEDHGGGFHGKPGPDYPNARGRMIARKTDPIWRWISRFKTPWPPFDWGSGMGLRGIDRDEAEALGVIGPDEMLTPLDEPFNATHEMSLQGVPESGRESLRSTFGDSIRIDGDTISIQRETTPESHEQRKQDIGTSLQQRARAIADAGRDQIRRFRAEDDVAPWTPGAESEILASTSAVAVGRKLLYHEQWPGSPESAESFAHLIREYLPDEVSVMVRDNHVHAWRPDILKLTPDEIQAKSEAHDNGELLGYGRNLFVDPFALVRFVDAKGNIVGGFQASAATARIYAAARARDFRDALGEDIVVTINGAEVAL